MNSIKNNIVELITLLLVFLLWFLSDYFFYDFLIIVFFAIALIIVFFKFIVSFFKKSWKSYSIIFILYLITRFFIAEDVKLANINALEKIESSKPAFAACCSEKEICEELGQEWRVEESNRKNSIMMTTQVKGWQANTLVGYIRYEDYYIIYTDYLISRNYHFRFECK